MVPSVSWSCPRRRFSRYLINTRRLRYVLKSLSARSQLPRRFPIQSAWRSPVTTIRHVRNVTPACPPPSSRGMRFLRRVCCLRKRKVGHQSSAKISALPGDLGPFFSLLPFKPCGGPYDVRAALIYLYVYCSTLHACAYAHHARLRWPLWWRMRRLNAGERLKRGERVVRKLANLQAVGGASKFSECAASWRIINSPVKFYTFSLLIFSPAFFKRFATWNHSVSIRLFRNFISRCLGGLSRKWELQLKLPPFCLGPQSISFELMSGSFGTPR